MTKKPRGRPALQPGEMARRVLVTLDDATITKGKRIGGKNLSNGLRIAVKRFKL